MLGVKSQLREGLELFGAASGRISTACATPTKKFRCIAHSHPRPSRIRNWFICSRAWLGARNAEASCERQTGTRRLLAPCFGRSAETRSARPLFHGSRPSLSRETRALLWPFDGDFAAILEIRPSCDLREPIRPKHTGTSAFDSVLALANESKPAAERQRLPFLSGLLATTIAFSEGLRSAIADGFGPLERGEDPFDAALGLLWHDRGRRRPETGCPALCRGD